jgi:hypothetical protein
MLSIYKSLVSMRFFTKMITIRRKWQISRLFSGCRKKELMYAIRKIGVNQGLTKIYCMELLPC